MDIQHEILSFDPTIGGITVRYYTESNSVGFTFNIDLPIENGSFPDETGVNSLVELYKPSGQLKRLEDIKTAVVPAFLAAKILPAPEENLNVPENL